MPPLRCLSRPDDSTSSNERFLDHGIVSRPDRLHRGRLAATAAMLMAATCLRPVRAQTLVAPAAGDQAAQTIPTAGVGPAQNNPGLAGPGSVPTPAHVAKARQLILSTGISRSFQVIVPEFMDQIGNTLTQSHPDLVPDMILVLNQLRGEFDRQSDEMIDQSARIYASILAERDIDGILAFFNSDAGRRYVGAQPLFLNQLVSGMQAWQQKISINMMDRVRQEMKKKGHDL